MIKFFLPPILFLMVGIGFSQSVDPDTSKSGNDSVLTGKVHRSDLQTGEFGQHFLLEYRSYNPDQHVIHQIDHKLFKRDIKIVLATWCHDSKMQVPRFFKIMDLLNYDTRTIEILAVDKQKKCGDIDISSMQIEKVPTFIFYSEDKETGRIVETPDHSLIKDIQHILND